MDATLSKRKGSKHGLGISSISVFTNFSCGIAVLRYWVPCNVPFLQRNYATVLNIVAPDLVK